jgi:ribonuclease T2
MPKSSLSPTLRLVLTLLAVLALIAFVYLNRSPEQSAPPGPATSSPRPATALPSGRTLTPATPERPLFDFYLLSLSWSPDYCADSGSSDPAQCGVGRKLGFVLHGLWPQYQRGYPSDCPTKQFVTSALKQQYAGLYPSSVLYDHEWTKHGSCTGLSPADYLALSQKLKESVVIPAAYRAPEQAFRASPQKLRADFTAANPGFSASSVAVFCSSSGRYLSELRVCFSPQGKPAACSTEVLHDSDRSCPNADFTVRSVR